MKKNKVPINIHKEYHAHVYFDQTTLSKAEKICCEAGKLFALKVGRVHQKPIGPHRYWSCQISFASEHFDLLVPWLALNREGLNVLVHGLTGNNLKDHTEYAYWLGEEVSLNLEIFKNN